MYIVSSLEFQHGPQHSQRSGFSQDPNIVNGSTGHNFKDVIEKILEYTEEGSTNSILNFSVEKLMCI